ncbi:MAG: methyltransferase domain-containing protein [Actinomycetota bacterium]|nr:methyltransferase domain-containing protein [Actinomycetota bacterium]
MQPFAAAELVEERVDTPAGEFLVRRPRDPASLISEESFGEDEYLPYWAERWPASERLCRTLPADLAGERVLELGCGLGVPSLCCARRGAEVLATDWSGDAIELLRANAAHNKVGLEARRVDWRYPTEVLARAPFDLVLAADVCYERRNVAPLAALLRALGAPVLLADPGRAPAGELVGELAADFTVDEAGPWVRRLSPRAAPARDERQQCASGTGPAR